MAEIIDMTTRERTFTHSVRLNVEYDQTGLYCDCGWKSEVWVTGMTVAEIVAIEEAHHREVEEGKRQHPSLG